MQPYRPQPSEDRPLVRVAMVRQDMADLPQAPLPDGFSFRMYQPGDEQHWVRIHELADWLGERTTKTFFDQFGSDLPALGDRSFFVVAPGGQVVGTSTAWYDNNFYGRLWGKVHWVAIAPDFQGRGLARPLLSATMNRLAESHDHAYLFTQTIRVPAG